MFHSSSEFEQINGYNSDRDTDRIEGDDRGSFHVRFQVFTPVTIKNDVFWDIKP
jgi:hypothetical protein